MEPDNRPFLKRLKYTLLYRLVLALIFVTEKLPRPLIFFIYGNLGRLAYYFAGTARETAIKNLTIVYGKEKGLKEIKQITKKMFENLGKNLADVLRVFPMETLEQFNKQVKVIGKEHLDAAYAKGKGVVLLTAHIGAFEILGTFVGLNYKSIMMGTKLKDPRLDALIVKSRSKGGSKYVHRGEHTLQLMRSLKEGRVMIILIDQDTKVKSRFVEFMGVPAATPVGATMMALKSGADIVPVIVQMDKDDNQTITCMPALEVIRTGNAEDDLVENTRQMNVAVDYFIRRDPSQWVWMHDRWKTKPGEEIL
ncbi:MAG: lysophospholipid acyltransferase family protein [Cytophagales bacterium]|nr:lysophospholipid acyltransferase family protein [Cytophaga sp.]